MQSQLAGITILLPPLGALLCLLIPSGGFRKLLVPLVAVALAVASILLFASGPFRIEMSTFAGLNLNSAVAAADFALLAVMLAVALRRKHWGAALLVLAQALPLAWFEFVFLKGHEHAAPALVADNLSLVMTLIISLIGSLICVFALPYMDEHERHLKLAKSRQPRFFFYLVLFLGAMNGLVFSDDLLWLYFFWEVTTFCSYALISHDGTEESVRNALRALWMNLLGGVAFVGAIIWAYGVTGTMSIQDLLLLGHTPGALALLLPAVALLCFAGFTKSAQAPFQSWLCGAMVAPTPVSALLHSSTMVKAGVYLVVRLAPLLAGTMVGAGVAVFGAFTFLAASALALTQSNGKKILAYSTIANLGVIMACAGIATPGALTAAILLIIFHAVSKGLLFLCVGTIEQGIGSRDIESMHGLSARMPLVAGVTVIGIMTMLLPPFGVLLAKWLAIEAAMRLPAVVLMLAFGSALTVVYWGRWAGLLGTRAGDETVERPVVPGLIRFVLVVLATAAVGLTLFVPQMAENLAAPFVRQYLLSMPAELAMLDVIGATGAQVVYPLVVIIGAAALFAALAAKSASREGRSTPYMGGFVPTGTGEVRYTGPLGQFYDTTVSNYYGFLLPDEGKFAPGLNAIAAIMIAFILGAAL